MGLNVKTTFYNVPISLNPSERKSNALKKDAFSCSRERTALNATSKNTTMCPAHVVIVVRKHVFSLASLHFEHTNLVITV